MSTSPNSTFDFDASSYPALPALRGLLVTGTDTGVGKTLIARAIARCLRQKGIAVEVFKPATSGCRHSREGLVSTDAEFLAACADSTSALSEIAPVRLAAALAPNVAAEREGRAVDLEEIFDAYRRLEDQCELVVVEGVGGLLCPISDDFWVVHLARLMALAVVIVARPGLGTINHTLLTIHAARSAGLHVAGVVINRYPPELQQVDSGGRYPACSDSEIAVLTNPRQIAERGRVAVLAVVPDEPANSVEEATLGIETQSVIGQVDWQRIAETWSGP